jgi:hypothetical protein
MPSYNNSHRADTARWSKKHTKERRLQMKHMILAATALLLSAAAAQADPFATMYGNTVTITDASGKSMAYVNQDMTWEQHMSDGKVMKGTYAWKDDHTACFTMTDPAPKPDAAPNCTKIDDHKVGDTWDEKDSKGQTTSYALTAGR